MTDIFEEVDESLRQERYNQAFRRYAPWGAAALAIIIAIVGGREYAVVRTATQAADGANAYAEAASLLEAGEPESARQHFADLAAARPDAYGAVAKMREAQLTLEAGAPGADDTAGQLYEDAAQLTNDPLLRDLALLKSAFARADGIDFPALETRLAPLSEPGQPFEYIARELLAASAMKAGEADRALEGYTFLSIATDVSNAQRSRAERALAVLRVQMDQMEEAEAE